MAVGSYGFGEAGIEMGEHMAAEEYLSLQKSIEQGTTLNVTHVQFTSATAVDK